MRSQSPKKRSSRGGVPRRCGASARQSSAPPGNCAVQIFACPKRAGKMAVRKKHSVRGRPADSGYRQNCLMRRICGRNRRRSAFPAGSCAVQIFACPKRAGRRAVRKKHSVRGRWNDGCYRRSFRTRHSGTRRFRIAKNKGGSERRKKCGKNRSGFSWACFSCRRLYSIVSLHFCCNCSRVMSQVYIHLQVLAE